MNPESPLYSRIYKVVRKIPAGKVSTYGAVARMVGKCGARNVGYALSSLKDDSVPWHRVINAKGEVSGRAEPSFIGVQQQLLEREGVCFNEKGRVDLGRFGYGWGE